MPMREECKHYQSRTYPSGEVARICELDLAPEAPWRCPDNCEQYERRLADAGWTYGSLVEPAIEDEPEEPPADIAGVLDAAEEIVNAVVPEAVVEVGGSRLARRAPGPGCVRGIKPPPPTRRRFVTAAASFGESLADWAIPDRSGSSSGGTKRRGPSPRSCCRPRPTRTSATDGSTSSNSTASPPGTARRRRRPGRATRPPWDSSTRSSDPLPSSGTSTAPPHSSSSPTDSCRRDSRSAALSDSEVAPERLGSLLGAVPEAFATLSEALTLDGFVISVAAGVTLERPVVVVHVFSDDAPGRLATSRTLVRLAPSASANVVELFVSGAAAHCCVPVTELELAEGAQLSYQAVQQLGPEAWSLGTS